MQILIESEKYLTPGGYAILEKINAELVPVWDRSTSSSGKYHQRADGTIPTIEEHTIEMLWAGAKIVKLFDYQEDKDHDIIYLGIILHDAMKYGERPAEHTTSKHDYIMATWLTSAPGIMEMLFDYYGPKRAYTLLNIIALHQGIWSKSTDFGLPSAESRFVHTLDMLSTHAMLKECQTNEEEQS